MSRLLFLIVAFFLSQIATDLRAQAGTPPQATQPSFEVRGRILDTANAPLPRASVSLRAKGSTVTVAGALTGADGIFRVTGLVPGVFQIRVAYIGYAPVIQDITISTNTPVLDLGVAKLAPLSVKLDAVTVTEAPATVSTEPDRTSYRANAIAPAASNASEVLENVPSVQVDQDGKVSLRGNENVVVQINGRPTPMRGPQLAAFLKSISANVIERIEVISNPSAKYDPDGMAGIINVALKANADLGLSGSINTSLSTLDRYNNSANIGYQSGPWTSFVSAGLISDQREAIGLNDRDRFDAGNTLRSSTVQNILLAPSNRGLNFNATVDYKLSAQDVLSNAFLFNRRSNGDVSTTTQTSFDGSGATIEEYVRPRESSARGSMFDYDVALKRSFAPQKHELSTEFRFNRAHDEDLADERRLVASPPGYINGRIDRNDAVTEQLTGQLDYVNALLPRTKLEMGWKSILREYDRDFDVTTDSTGTGGWAVSSQSNDFALDEGTHALYAVVSRGVGKWDLQAGLRGEYATRTFSLATESYPFDYGSLFPSANAVYNVSPATQLKVSYSRRVRRPGPQELNPFPTYFDADNVFLGTPDLSPEYTDAFELGLTKNGGKGMLQLTPFYRVTSDVIRIIVNTADTLDNREITSISFNNLARSDSWGADLTGQLRLGPLFSALTNFSLFRTVTDGGSMSALSSDAVGWMGRINLTSEVTRALTLQAAYNYRAPMKIEGGEMGAHQMANVSMRYKIQADKGVLTLRVADPFEMIRFRVRAGDEKLMQLTQRNPQSRMVFLGYQYNFGRPPRVRQVAPEQTGGGSVGFGPPG